MPDANRLQPRRRMLIGRGELEILRQAARDNQLGRSSMLLGTEGVLIAQAGGDLAVSGIPGNAFVTVAAGEAYLDDDRINLPVATAVNLPGGPGPATYGLRISHAVSRYEPGTISVTMGLTAVVGVGTRFTAYSPEDRIEFDTGGGNDGVLWVIDVITNDLNMTVTAPFAATEATVSAWQYRAHFALPAAGAVFDTTTPAGAYDGFAFVIDANPPAADEILLADVTTDAGGNFASLVDQRSASRLTFHPSIGRSLTDTYGIYPNDTLQDHVDAVGAIRPWVFATANNPHGTSAYELHQPSTAQVPALGISPAVRMSALLDEIVHIDQRVFIPHSEILGTNIVNAVSFSAWSNVASDVVGSFYFQLPRQSVIRELNDWQWDLWFIADPATASRVLLELNLYAIIPGFSVTTERVLHDRVTFWAVSGGAVQRASFRGNIAAQFSGQLTHGFYHGMLTKVYDAPDTATIDVLALSATPQGYFS